MGSGWTEQVLHSFSGRSDGAAPEAGLILDAHGNLYGTTVTGGANFRGTVFELSPMGGGWTERVLYSFQSGSDASHPRGSLIFDRAGNLYGTTNWGGNYSRGAIYELSKMQGGTWSEQVLYNFGNGSDAAHPVAALVFDANGNLYGTTDAGGTKNFGTIFELSPGRGGWTEQILENFGADTANGFNPLSTPIFDTSGNIYITNVNGGAEGDGTVFELSPMHGGGWTGKVLCSFNFNGTDGDNPFAGLIADSAGDLYGMTSSGGTYDSGIVFQLTPAGGGRWTEKIVWNFGKGTDAAVPEGNLVFDSAGNLYSASAAGGIYNGGTVFELSPLRGGGWTEKVLYSFNPQAGDGWEPFAGLVLDSSGNLYGTTYIGGVYNAGTVFELSRSGGVGWSETILHNFNPNPNDGFEPMASLVIDAVGNLYGTTLNGGTNSAGTVFVLTPVQGTWVESLLWNFGNGSDGAYPYGNLVFDSVGNLYGTTSSGGSGFGGTVFELSRNGSGWGEQVLYNFTGGSDGGSPESGVTLFGGRGNLYGTTIAGGSYGSGTVFELTPQQGGTWVETVLHSFNPNAFDGTFPQATLLLDNNGTHLYGTTTAGGFYNNGTVFSITP